MRRSVRIKWGNILGKLLILFGISVSPACAVKYGVEPWVYNGPDYVESADSPTSVDASSAETVDASIVERSE